MGWDGAGVGLSGGLFVASVVRGTRLDGGEILEVGLGKS